MISSLLKLFKPKAQPNKIQSFTFYIPSPPDRKNGYREKQFDKLFYTFINKGYEILSIHTTPNSHASRSGMWFICIVRAKNKEAEALDFESYFHDQLEQSENSEKEEDFDIEKHKKKDHTMINDEFIFIANDDSGLKKSSHEE